MFCLQTSFIHITVLCQNQINKPHHFISFLIFLGPFKAAAEWWTAVVTSGLTPMHIFLLLPQWHATFLPRIQTADSQQTAADPYQIYLLLYQHKKKDHS